MNTSSKPAGDKDIAQQIFDLMVKLPGGKPGYRPVHAKGIVCQGTFAPSKDAATISKAAHFQGAPVLVTVRFSDGAPDPSIPDNSPDAGPRGMAVRFHLPGDGKTDIVALSHNGFIVSNGEEFLALQQAVAATDPSQPHPWPIEVFLGTRPLALKFVLESRVIPASFATESFFSNNSFVFVNKNGVKQAGRYQILPLAGQQNLNDTEAKAGRSIFSWKNSRPVWPPGRSSSAWWCNFPIPAIPHMIPRLFGPMIAGQSTPVRSALLPLLPTAPVPKRNWCLIRRT